MEKQNLFKWNTRKIVEINIDEMLEKGRRYFKMFRFQTFQLNSFKLQRSSWATNFANLDFSSKDDTI